MVWKRTRRCWQQKGKAERSNGAVFVFQLFVVFFFLLSLGLELFPEGPLQLRDRQSEGEGAVGFRPDNSGLKTTGEENVKRKV